MLADQMGRGLAHAVDVQRLLDLPDQPRLMCRRRATYQHTKQIPAFERGKTGVKIIIHRDAIDDRNGQWFQMIVDRLGQAERGPVTFHIAMGDLRQRVDTGVGAPCGGDVMGARFDLGQSGLYRALDRRKVDLALPADKRGTVVFDFQGIALHGGPFTLRVPIWQSLTRVPMLERNDR